MKLSRRLGKGSERSKGFLLVQPPRRNTPETVETPRAILRNTNMNMHRRQRPDLVEDWDAMGDPRPAFGAERLVSAEETVLDDILTEDLEAAVNSLDNRFRTVLLLVDVDRLTYAEAAEALGVPVGTVMSRLSRARDRVRAHLRAHTSSFGRTP